MTHLLATEAQTGAAGITGWSLKSQAGQGKKGNRPSVRWSILVWTRICRLLGLLQDLLALTRCLVVALAKVVHSM